MRRIGLCFRFRRGNSPARRARSGPPAENCALRAGESAPHSRAFMYGADVGTARSLDTAASNSEPSASSGIFVHYTRIRAAYSRGTGGKASGERKRAASARRSYIADGCTERYLVRTLLLLLLVNDNVIRA